MACSTRSKLSSGPTATSMRSSLPYRWMACCAAAISSAANSAWGTSMVRVTRKLCVRPSRLSVTDAGQWSRAASARVSTTPSSPSRSNPYSGTEPMVGMVACASITGEKWTSKGSAVKGAIHRSSIPPLARISRSLLPVSVCMEERKLPVAASPARSIATITATPSATARAVSTVRSRSRRSGRRIRVRNRFMRARWSGCVRPADVPARRRWPLPPRCGSP